VRVAARLVMQRKLGLERIDQDRVRDVYVRLVEVTGPDRCIFQEVTLWHLGEPSFLGDEGHDWPIWGSPQLHFVRGSGRTLEKGGAPNGGDLRLPRRRVAGMRHRAHGLRVDRSRIGPHGDPHRHRRPDPASNGEGSHGRSATYTAVTATQPPTDRADREHAGSATTGPGSTPPENRGGGGARKRGGGFGGRG
jgi:hypothetical protein